MFIWPGWVALAGEVDGRDFPKTLIFDEPGIDDEVSLPTVVYQPQQGGSETDVDFELDKRLTRWLSVQINAGYTALDRIGKSSSGGWQNTDVTLKAVAYSNPADEQLVSVSLVRELGGSGARQIDADSIGSTGLALNFGQGFASLAASPLLKPFAVTGVGEFLLPDAEGAGSARQALLSASLQYSLDVLMQSGAGHGLPDYTRRLIPIVEFTYAAPAGGGVAAHGLLAPGMIYSGDGFQLAAEALLPLTRASGTHIGMIAQLNISLSMFGIPVLTRPLL